MTTSDAERWARLEALFEAALERPENERDAFIERTEPDPELRREVRAMLDGEGDADQRLEAIVGQAAADASGAGRVGQQLGPYRIERELGHGGMGSVFLAHRVDGAFEGQVAIKLIRGLHTSEHLRRFQTERRILARLDHPHIARLLDAGSAPDGAPYVVMEYVDGVPITEYAEGKDVQTLVRLLISVGEAIVHAHRNLIVHRDLKPANILVRPDGAPRLLDFGIARLLDDQAGTGSDLRALTPAYASPEQILGHPITVATDVYGLGLVAYRLLAGRLPFGDPGASIARTTREVTEGDPPAPSRLAERTDRSKRLRGDLDTIVLEALRKRPEDRYSSVEALVEDLERWLEGRPVNARAPSLPYRLGKAVRRHPWPYAAGAAALMASAAFVVQLDLQARENLRQRDAARRAQQRAESVTRFLVDLFEVSDPSESRGASSSAREILDRGAERIEDALQSDPIRRAAMLEVLGRVHRNLGSYAEAEQLLERALAERLEQGAPPEALAASHHELGELRTSLQQLAPARTHLQTALALRQEAADGQPSAEVASTLDALGVVASDEGHHQEAETHFRAALDIRRALHPEPHPDVATQMVSLGHALRRQERFDEARPLLIDALAMRRRLLGNDHLEVGHSLNQLARLEFHQGELAQAESHAREGLAIRVASFGPDHIEVAASWGNLATILEARGDRAQAVDALNESLSALLAAVGEDHPWVAQIRKRRELLVGSEASGPPDVPDSLLEGSGRARRHERNREVDGDGS